MKAIYEKINRTEDQSFYLEVVSKPFFPDPWHFHPEIEILYIKEGHGTRYVGDSINTYSPGDIVIIGPTTPHVYSSDPVYLSPHSNLVSTAICVQFREDFLGNTIASLPEYDRVNHFLHEAHRGIQFINQTRDILIEMLEGLPSRIGMTRLIGLLRVLDIMSTTTDIKYLSSPNYKPIKVNPEDKDRMEAIFRYVIQNYTKKTCLGEISSMVHLTPHSFCRYFKSRTTKSFSTFVNEVRIGNACKMLIENKYSISEICYLSGFNYLSNFNRRFKKAKGMTPSDYICRYKDSSLDALYDK